MRIWWTITSCLLLIATPTWPAEKWSDEFDAPDLDRTMWCPCQINNDRAPVEFLSDPDDAGHAFARITANIHSLGGNKCRKGPPHNECSKGVVAQESLQADVGAAATKDQQESPEYLGPSFMATQNILAMEAAPQPAQNPHCTDEIAQQAKAAGEEEGCIQRQELRFQDDFAHIAEQPYIYTLRFRLPAVIEDQKNSIRWVTAQWKQEPYSPDYDEEFKMEGGFSTSPVLAQRFDDGVLHVTVQDEHCRCRVASALLPNGSKWSAKPGVAWDCLSTRPGDPDGRICTPDLTLEYGENPVLPSAKGAWVTMTYRVQMVRDKPAAIEVHADGRLIVRATGKIGYKPDPSTPSEVKFKIGHYRDYLPSVDQIDIDSVKVERAH